MSFRPHWNFMSHIKTFYWSHTQHARAQTFRYLYTLGAIIFENHIINHDFLSVFKWGLPTSTSIFSAISASIFKISVPIIKRRSSGFRNTPRSHLSDEYWQRKQQKTKKLSKLIKTPIFGDLPFSLNCHYSAQNNPNFASWGCFGILRTSSWWWAQRFLKLMHPGLRNWRKRESHF